MITHLKGSLSQNITDITKGGGCPKIKSVFKNYNVLRYFSRVKDDTSAFVGGVVGDGGNIQIDGYERQFINTAARTFTPSNYTHGARFEANLSLHSKFLSFPLSNDTPPAHGAGNPYNTQGNGNYLNICNMREIVTPSGGTTSKFETAESYPNKYYKEFFLNDEADNTICNIESSNRLIEKDIDGFYNYKLYAKNHTMDIIKAGTETPISETADLMEFVSLRFTTKKCQHGQLYIELIDFDLVGAIFPDYMVHFYCWETETENRNLSDEFQHDVHPEMLATNNGNEPIKSVRLSDIKGKGNGKKMIIWINRLKAKGETFTINVLIGLKPQDLRRDGKDTLDYTDLSNPIVWTQTKYETLDNLTLKFKNIRVKYKKTRDAARNYPMPHPCYGDKLLQTAGGGGGNHYRYTMESNGKISIYTEAGDNHNNVYGIGGGQYDNAYYPGWSIVNFYTFGSYQFGRYVDPTKTYILKMPSFATPFAYSQNSSAVQIPLAATFKIGLYIGNAIEGNNNATYTANFLSQLTLIQYFSVTDLHQYSWVDYYSEWHKNPPRSVEIAGSLLANFYPCYFFLSLEVDGKPIKTTVINPATTTKYDVANVELFREYYFSRQGNAGNNYSFDPKINFDCMLFQEPQIINISNNNPELENYWPEA